MVILIIITIEQKFCSMVRSAISLYFPHRIAISDNYSMLKFFIFGDSSNHFVKLQIIQYYDGIARSDNHFPTSQ